MDNTSILIEFLLKKYSSEKKWTLKVMEQLSDEDIVWTPTPESNSIANIAAHIWGTVHQRILLYLYGCLIDALGKGYKGGYYVPQARTGSER